MITSRTYTVGANGGVRKLTDLTLPWVDVSVAASLPATASFPLYDVETDPLDGDKVFAVGQGTVNANVFGIYVSLDGGTNWIIPGGDYQTNTIQSTLNWYEVWVLDSNNIMVAGHNGYMAKSTDGGLTFNLTTQLPLLPPCGACINIRPTAWSVHFITPSIGVMGLNAHVVKTINGGVSWAILNGGNVIEDGSVELLNARGIHISSDQQTIVAVSENAIFRSTDFGTSWVNVYSFQSGNGRHLTWINDQEMWAFGNLGERVKSIDGGATWTILNLGGPGGATQLAGHFYNGQNGFFSQNNTILSTNNGALFGTPSEVSPYGVNAVWTFYNETCYRLISCDDSAAPIEVGNDLSGNIGDVIRVCPDDIPDPDFNVCTCFTIFPGSCEGALMLPEPLSIFEDCETCTPKCYLLTDCLDETNIILTSDDFEEYIGQVVKLSECPETCWQVAESETCVDAVCVSEVIESFLTCVACLPPVPVPPPLELHPRRVKPGYYTPGCSPEYTEKTSCNFAEQMYNEMLVNRYGLTVCCEEDRLKWLIKKKLLDFKAIYDPSLCKHFVQSCCAPTCLEVTLQVFNPTLSSE